MKIFKYLLLFFVSSVYANDNISEIIQNYLEVNNYPMEIINGKLYVQHDFSIEMKASFLNYLAKKQATIFVNNSINGDIIIDKFDEYMKQVTIIRKIKFDFTSQCWQKNYLLPIIIEKDRKEYEKMINFLNTIQIKIIEKEYFSYLEEEKDFWKINLFIKYLQLEMNEAINNITENNGFDIFTFQLVNYRHLIFECILYLKYFGEKTVIDEDIVNELMDESFKRLENMK
jgi:hypothetical protein